MNADAVEQYLAITAACGAEGGATRAGGFGALTMWWRQHEGDDVTHQVVLDFVTSWLRAETGAIGGPAGIDVEAAARVLVHRPPARVAEPIALPRVQLRGMDLAGVRLVGADLSAADLAGTDLTGADLSGADLTRASVAEADLSGADLTGATLTDLDVCGTDLSRARGLAEGRREHLLSDQRTRW